MSYFTDRIGNTYKVIKNYINPDVAKELAKRFIDDTKDDLEESFEGILMKTKYNYIPSVALLSEKTSEVNYIMGSKLIPSYCYTRNYPLYSTLRKHKDRDSCEISLSIHLDSDKDWEFCIEDINGNDVEIILKPGDAILYDACNANHWRKGKYTGEYYIQTFHHYVLLDGEKQNNYFERKSGNLKLEDFIVHKKNYIDYETCDFIVKRYEESLELEIDAATNSGSSEYRKCKTIFAPKIGKDVDNKLFEIVDSICSNFIKFKNEIQDAGYSILKYTEGGKYDVHTDQGIGDNRAITLIFNLNDNYEGGELKILDKIYKLEKGDFIYFPSNYMYPHSILPITKGERYSMVTWLV